ncbi:MAG: hypothetical protein Q7T67_06190, partial [Patulibacter sp.]
RSAATARRTARRATRAAKARPAVVTLAAGTVTAPAGRVGSIVELPLTAAGRALVEARPETPLRATIGDEARTLSVRR